MYITLEDVLKSKGITRYELAKNTGITYPTIDRIYKGEANRISFSTLEAICDYLDCTPNDILKRGEKSSDR